MRPNKPSRPFLSSGLLSMLSAGFLLFCVTGCQTAYYKTMEKFGYHKRDILVSRVEEARDSQEETKEQFKDALQQFSSVTRFQGGQLEAKYRELESAYETSESKAEEVRNRIAKVEEVSEALFQEWEEELQQYSSESLRNSSREKLTETQVRYRKMILAMKQAESKIAPVLTAFKDQVLFLKHNLNAQAIASIQADVKEVEDDIATLIREMETSIAAANAFIKEMGNV